MASISPTPMQRLDALASILRHLHDYALVDTALRADIERFFGEPEDVDDEATVAGPGAAAATAAAAGPGAVSSEDLPPVAAPPGAGLPAPMPRAASGPAPAIVSSIPAYVPEEAWTHREDIGDEAPEPVDVDSVLRGRLLDHLRGDAGGPLEPPPDAFGPVRTHLAEIASAFDARRVLAASARARQTASTPSAERAASAAHADAEQAFRLTSPSGADERFWTLLHTRDAAFVKRLDAHCALQSAAARRLGRALGASATQLRERLHLAADAAGLLRRDLHGLLVQDGAEQRFRMLLQSLAPDAGADIDARLSLAPAPLPTLAALRALLRQVESDAPVKPVPPSPTAAWPEAAQEPWRTLQHHLRQVTDARPLAGRDLDRVGEALSAIVDAGVPPSNVLLRETLDPVLGALAACPQPQVQRVVLAIDEAFRKMAEHEMKKASVEDRQAWREDPAVRAMRDLVARRPLVVIGGKNRRHNVDRLQEAFDTEVRWIASDVHQSPYAFERDVSQPDVCAVLMLIRWSSHSYEDVQELAERAGKAFVRVPGGYSPVMIAKCLNDQASHHLSGSAE